MRAKILGLMDELIVILLETMIRRNGSVEPVQVELLCILIDQRD